MAAVPVSPPAGRMSTPAGAPPPAPRTGRGPLLSATGLSASLLGVPLVLVPLAVYLLYVVRFGVNVPWQDEWNFVPLLHMALTGHLTLAALWAQHNENRLLFPNLILLGMAGLTHYNVKDEMLASAGLLMVSFGGLGLLYRRHRLGPSWGLVPVAFLVFSLSQNAITLTGFALTWYLVVLGLVVALVALEGLGTHWWALPLAAVGATLASYSALQGLLVWPAMLPYLLRAGTTWVQRAVWTGLAAAAWALYFAGLNLSAQHAGGGHLHFLLHQPLTALRYFVVLVGAVIPSTSAAHGDGQTILFGLLILGLAAVTLGWTVVTRRVQVDRAVSFPLALILFGLLFDLFTTVGRASFGVAEATASRYTIYNLDLLAGIYLVLLHWVRREGRGATATAGAVLIGVVATLLVCQVGLSLRYGWLAGVATHSTRLEAADLVVNFDHAPSALIHTYVYAFPSFLPPQVRVLRQYRLSVFATPAARAYAREGLVPGGRLGPSLPTPPTLQALLRGSARARQAWRMLSTVYQTRPDLRAAYPQGSAGFAAHLLGWATTAGVTTDIDHVFLDPYRGALTRLRAAAG